MKFGIVVFPGTWSDTDCYHVVDQVLREPVEYVWHQDTDLSSYDCVVLPGGFSYGDHLRAGALARFSPVMEAVEEFAADGGLVIGICNGFQILCEAGLLPGVLTRNAHLQFRCQWVNIRVERASGPFSGAGSDGQVDPDPDLTRRGQLLRRPGDARPPGIERTGGVQILHAGGRDHRGGQSERLCQEHRRDYERPGQRARHDASP